MDYGTQEVREERTHPITFVDIGKLRAIPSPLARISLCGMIEIEVLTNVVSDESGKPQGCYEVLSFSTLRGRGAVPSLTLLKLLAGCSHRFATCDWLSEQMRGEMDEGALVRLDTIASYLRGILCHLKTEREDSINVLRLTLVAYVRNGRSSGPGYQLAPYPLIWLDTDALASHVEHAALMERMNEPDMAFPFWQHAYELAARGTYLADEPSSEWAQEPRDKAEGALRQSVHALHRLSFSLRGKAGKEEAIVFLRTYWLGHKTDEDALRPLLELLGESERFGEAEAYYQHLCHALDLVESGKQPDTRTQDIREFLRVKQIQREHTPTKAVEAVKHDPDSLLHPKNIMAMPSSFSQAITQGILEAVRELEGDTHLDTSRRRLLQQTLPTLLGVTGSVLNSSVFDMLSPMTDDSVSFYSAAIPACWSLVYNGGIEYIEKVLPSYLTHLTAIIQQSPQDHKQAASLASQGYKLANLLDLRREDFTSALRHSKDALLYGQIAEDSNLQIAALIEEALTFWYRKHFAPSLTTYQKALYLIENDKRISPIIKGRVYAGLAAAYATHKQEQEALRSIGLAYDTFSDHPESDPNFSYTHYSHYYLYLYEANMYTHLEQPKKVLSALTHLHVPAYASRRAEIVNKEAAALLAFGDLEQCSAKIETSATLALSTGSGLRYSQAYEIYQGMVIKWPHEQPVKNLAQIFQQ